MMTLLAVRSNTRSCHMTNHVPRLSMLAVVRKASACFHHQSSTWGYRCSSVPIKFSTQKRNSNNRQKVNGNYKVPKYVLKNLTPLQGLQK